MGVFAVPDSRWRGVEDVGARLEGVVTFHDGCHALRELGIKDGPRRLLAHVRGLELREMDAAEECCGFGGTFSVKFPEVSGGMARTKIDAIVRTGASTVVSVGFELPDAIAGRALARRLADRHACIWRRCWRAANDYVQPTFCTEKIHDRRWRPQAAIGHLQGHRPADGTSHARGRAQAPARLPGTAHAGQRRSRSTPSSISITTWKSSSATWMAHGGKVVYCQDGDEVVGFRAGPGQGARRAADREIEIDDHRGDRS